MPSIGNHTIFHLDLRWDYTQAYAHAVNRFDNHNNMATAIDAVGTISYGWHMYVDALCTHVLPIE